MAKILAIYSDSIQEVDIQVDIQGFIIMTNKEMDEVIAVLEKNLKHWDMPIVSQLAEEKQSRCHHHQHGRGARHAAFHGCQGSG